MINSWGSDGTAPQTHKSCLEKATHFLFIVSFLMLFKLQFCWLSITDSSGVPVKNTGSLGLELRNYQFSQNPRPLSGTEMFDSHFFKSPPLFYRGSTTQSS